MYIERIVAEMCQDCVRNKAAQNRTGIFIAGRIETKQEYFKDRS